MKVRTLLAFVIAIAMSASVTGIARAATITDIVAQSGGEGEFDDNSNDYDILLNAVLTAGLADALADESAQYTVFAPKDLAFIRLARDLGYGGWDEAEAWGFLVAALTDLGDGNPIPVLTSVLLYHVVDGEVRPFGLILYTLFRMPIETLQGGFIQPRFFRLKDNDPDLRDPRVIWPLNIDASNGVIHTINRVLIPIDL